MVAVAVIVAVMVAVVVAVGGREFEFESAAW
jgi:hypothetical protein